MQCKNCLHAQMTKLGKRINAFGVCRVFSHVIHVHAHGECDAFASEPDPMQLEISFPRRSSLESYLEHRALHG